MAIRTDDEIRRYLSAAWECVESGESEAWWALRGKWHKGDPLPLRDPTDVRSDPQQSAEADEKQILERGLLEPGTEPLETVALPVVEPDLTRAEAWGQLRQLWDSIERIDYGYAATQLQPLLAAEWPDVRAAAVRYELVLEQRQWILSNFPQQPSLTLVAPFLQLLAMPERLIGTDQQQFRVAVYNDDGLAESFRMFCYRLEANAPPLARECRDLLEYLRQRPVTVSTSNTEKSTTTSAGTILIVIVAVVIPVLRFFTTVSRQSPRTLPVPVQQLPSYQSTPGSLVPTTIIQPPPLLQPSTPFLQQSDDPQMEADLRRLNRLLGRLGSSPFPDEGNMPAFQELLEWQRSDPQRLNKVRGERQRRLSVNPRAFDAPGSLFPHVESP